jgi:hypothetical protein
VALNIAMHAIKKSRSRKHSNPVATFKYKVTYLDLVCEDEKKGPAQG